jgi:transposase
VDGSPQPPRAIEPVKKQGAPPTGSAGNPNSRLGRKSPHSQGRVMEQPPTSPSFVGIDVSKDRLDVHVRPSGQAFAVTRDGKDLEQLTNDLRALAPALIVLEATGRFEITWPLLWRAGAFRLRWSTHARSVISPAPPAGSPPGF